MKPSDKKMTDLNRLLKTQEFKDPKELENFLSSLIGQTIPEFEPEALSIAEQAEDLVSEAYDIEPEEALGNVLEALTMDPNCIPAYEYLGSIQAVSHLAMPYYAYGVEIGRKKFSKEMTQDRGHFWGIVETRPFMRCFNNYASCLVGMGHAEKTLEIYKEILELNENDNMGVRNQYGLFLIWAEMFDDYIKLDKQFEMESTAMPSFNRALHSFLTKGDCLETIELLKKAKAQNKYFIPVLTAKH
jgi:tetratricopeptide (TPR) repeat protein